MPVYQTKCSVCQTEAPRKLTFGEYASVHSGQTSLSCQCGGSVGLVFDPSAVSFILADGPSGGWQSKALRENKYRTARGKLMDQRTRDHVKPNKLIPNHNGQTVGSWAEAKDAAYQSTYERVNREHGAKVAASAASQSAKTYDTHVKKEAP